MSDMRLCATPRCVPSLQQAQSLLLFRQIVDSHYGTFPSFIQCCCQFYSATCPD